MEAVLTSMVGAHHCITEPKTPDVHANSMVVPQASSLMIDPTKLSPFASGGRNSLAVVWARMELLLEDALCAIVVHIKTADAPR